MNLDLGSILALILGSNLCDTGNHLGLKTSADAVGIRVHNLRTAAAFILKIVRLPTFWMSIILGVVSLFLWLAALTRADLSFAFSLDSFHHVLIAWASAVVLKERLSLKRCLGTAIIVFGIFL